MFLPKKTMENAINKVSVVSKKCLVRAEEATISFSMQNIYFFVSLRSQKQRHE